MFSNKNKQNLLKAIFTITLAFFIALSPLKAEKSEAWLSFAAAQYKQMLENIQKRIDGIILSIQKQQAILTITTQMEKSIVGGVNGSPKFITDWEDYLVKTPEKITNKYMNDYLSNLTAGRGSGSNYVPVGCTAQGFCFYDKVSSLPDNSSLQYASEGFFASSVSAAEIDSTTFSNPASTSISSTDNGGNYYKDLMEIAKKATYEKEEPKVTYEGNPAAMFSDGTFKNFSLYISGINPPWMFQANAEQEYQKKLEEEKRIAQSRAESNYGFIGTGEKDGQGQITMPGSLIKENIANVQDLPNKVLASATHPEEIITALVSQLITKAIDQGIGEIQSKIQNEVTDVTNKINENLDDTINQFGPGANYDNNTDLGNCHGKKDGDACKLTNPYNGSTDGKCASALCWPIKK